MRRMAEIISEDRFDEPEYGYHGFNYEIRVKELIFKIRTYDDEPRIATVVSGARTSPEAHELVAFLMSKLQCNNIRFGGGARGYQRVDVRTLEFVDEY